MAMTCNKWSDTGHHLVRFYLWTPVMAVSVKSNKNFLWLSAVFLPAGFLSSTSAKKNGKNRKYYNMFFFFPSRGYKRTPCRPNTAVNLLRELQKVMLLGNVGDDPNFNLVLQSFAHTWIIDASVVFKKTLFAAHDACHCWCCLQRMLVLLAAADCQTCRPKPLGPQARIIPVQPATLPMIQ